MRKLKKIAAGLLTAVLALGMLTACSSKDINVSAVKSWTASTTGKLLGNIDESGNNYYEYKFRMLTYRDEGTKKYLIRTGESLGGESSFIGSKEYGWLNIDANVNGSYVDNCIVNHTKKTYEKDNSYNYYNKTTKFQGSDVDKALWRLLNAEYLNWVLAGINTYESKQYYTEVVKASFGGAINDWVASLDGNYSNKEYTFVLYYESEEASMPKFIRIDGQGLNDVVVNVSDFQRTKYNDVIPAPYDSLLSITGYTAGTVTK